ncbi:MAG: hypothetical protein ABIP48_00320 [Planctomycetota bacterium]
MKFGRRSAVGLVVVGCCLAVTTPSRAQDAEYLPGTPFTYLFDAGSASPRMLSARALAAKEGWTLVPEDDAEHAFRGDAVLVNDKLAVVLRSKGPGAEVYSQTPGGARFRAVVMAADRTAVMVQGISSVEIVENNPGAVELNVTFQTDGAAGRFSAGYRLTTGQAMLEMTGGPAAERFFVWTKTRYVVVPNFFADDMVFSPAICDLPRFGLPTENFFLNLIEGGDSMVMCVWRSGRQDAHAILTGEGPERVIRGCEVEGGEERMLSVAIIEAAGIWHEEMPTEAQGQGKDLAKTAWKPSFDAWWRVDRVSAAPLTVSSDLSKAQLVESGPLSRDISAITTLVYPLDRNLATPLTAFCPIDVLRSTLGVGPCQYILQTEGLASDSNPTPDHVMSWVEKQFKTQKEEESAEEIKAQLAQMADHVVRAQARIEQYAAFAREVQSLGKAEGESRGEPESVRKLSETVASLVRITAAEGRVGEPAERAAKTADAIVALIGKKDALPACQRLGLEVRRIGAEQDRTLSACRMTVRWLERQARMSIIRTPENAGMAEKIRALAERFLNEE